MGRNITRRVALVVAALFSISLVACKDDENTTLEPSAEECQDIESKVSVAAQAVTEAEEALAQKESGRNKQALREAEARLEELRATQVVCDAQSIDTTPDGSTTTTPDTSVPGSTTSTTLPGNTGGTEISDEVVALLTVNTFTPGECLELTNSESTGVVPYEIGALELPTPQGPRLWNDALSIPLPDGKPADQLLAFKEGICEDTLTGVTWGRFFAQMEIGGRKLIDLNPWLEVFDVSEEEINDLAAGYIPLLDADDPTDAEKAEAVEKNQEWQGEAEKLIALIDRFSLLWVDSLTSVVNYHLVAGGVVVGGLPEVGLNPNQESLPALLLMISEKGACAPLKIIGINVGDRRPEEFASPPCAPPPSCDSDCTTTSTRPPCTSCASTTVPNGKPGVPTTVSPPPVTPPSNATTTTHGSGGDSGPGAPPPATTVAPKPTVAPPGTIPAPTSAPPTTRVEGP